MEVTDQHPAKCLPQCFVRHFFVVTVPQLAMVVGNAEGPDVPVDPVLLGLAKLLGLDPALAPQITE